MKNIAHPSTLLYGDWIDIIRKEAKAAEQKGFLQEGQLKLIYEQQWFNLVTPKAYGGLEVELPQLVKLEEALSWADGSTGWVITLATGAGWFGGFLKPDVARKVYADPKACLAGSGAATGTATITDDGYILNGKWKYASGLHHATYITANFIVKRGEETVLTEDGNPMVVPFIIDRKDVTLVPTWKYVGMMGTGSHAFEVNNVKVNTSRSFKIAPDAAVIDSPVYRYPFLQLAEATLAANISGIALHFIDLCKPVFKKKLSEKNLTVQQQAVLNDTLKEVKYKLQGVREEFYEAFEASWTAEVNKVQTAVLLHLVSKTSLQLAKYAREAVDTLYPYCGLIAASPDTEINQVWRDLHTASQHSLLTFLK